MEAGRRVRATSTIKGAQPAVNIVQRARVATKIESMASVLREPILWEIY